MRHRTLLLGLSTLVLAGCNNNQQEPAAYSEEPYTPSYASLDAMESAPVADATYYDPPPAQQAADTTMAEPADEPLTPVGGRVHTVLKGDTLFSLARHYYNDQARWRGIWDANRNRLGDPDQLVIGMKLIIP